MQVYKSYFEKNVNPTNLALFIDSYVKRTDLNIHRDPDPTKKNASTLKVPVINITGALSPHADDTVTFNGRLDPTNSSWMKVCKFEKKIIQETCQFRRFLTAEWFWKNNRAKSVKHSDCSFKAKAMVSKSAPIQSALVQ